MADYDHHGHMAEVLGTRERPLSAVYLSSYGDSDPIAAEHLLDADALVKALTTDPTKPIADLRRLAGPARRLATLDVGAGEAAKSARVANSLAYLLDLTEIWLYAVEPDPQMAARIPDSYGRVRIIRLVQTFESLLTDLDAGRVRLDPAPAYATDFHSVYYRPRSNGIIPSVARLPELLADPAMGFCAYICEGPGQLQELKQFMVVAAGLAEPTSHDHILASLIQADVPRRRPIPIPNRWTFPLAGDPGEMFAAHFGFLLDGNWGSRQVTARDHQIAGTWVRSTARSEGQTSGDVGWLDGPDSLILAGERYR